MPYLIGIDPATAIQPRRALLLVYLDFTVDYQSPSGLLIDSHDANSGVLGTVIKVGPAVLHYHAGDRILFPAPFGEIIRSSDGTGEWRLIAESDVLGTVVPESQPDKDSS